MQDLGKGIAILGVWAGIGYAISNLSATGNAVVAVALFLGITGAAATFFVWHKFS